MCYNSKMNTFEVFTPESVEFFGARSNPGADQIDLAEKNYGGTELPAYDTAYFVTPEEVALKACTHARVIC